MKHAISYDEWLGYLDGELPPAVHARVAEHIAACAECRVVWEELLTATVGLRSASEQYIAASRVSAEAVSRSRGRVIARIRALAEPEAVEVVAEGELTAGRLRRLQNVVAPACGAHTAFRLIVAAVGRTPSPGSMSAWQRFLEQLTELTSALCGRSIARLVWEIGNSLP